MLETVSKHRERLDGSGYPNGILENSISEAVRIMTLCDIFAAMTDPRAYAPPFHWRTALAVIAPNKSQIDLILLRPFTTMILGGSVLPCLNS